MFRCDYADYVAAATATDDDDSSWAVRRRRPPAVLCCCLTVPADDDAQWRPDKPMPCAHDGDGDDGWDRTC